MKQNRRRVLKVIGVTGIIGVAGCGGFGGSNDDTPPDSGDSPGTTSTGQATDTNNDDSESEDDSNPDLPYDPDLSNPREELTLPRSALSGSWDQQFGEVGDYRNGDEYIQSVLNITESISDARDRFGLFEEGGADSPLGVGDYERYSLAEEAITGVSRGTGIGDIGATIFRDANAIGGILAYHEGVDGLGEPDLSRSQTYAEELFNYWQ